MKRLFHIILCFLTVFMLNGCGAEKDTASPEEIACGADGSLVIPVSYFDEGVNQIDLISGDYAMQLLAHRGSNGQPKLSWNTCQVCNGSPYAYFEYLEGWLVCRNCGNVFPVDSIGGENSGCYPWPVSEYSVDETTVTVPADAIAAMEPNFRNWRKGV